MGIWKASSQGETLGETAWTHKVNNTSAIASLEAARKTRPVTGISFVCFTVSAKPKEHKANLLEKKQPMCLYIEGSYNSDGTFMGASWGHAIKDRFTQLLKTFYASWSFPGVLINLTLFLLSLEKLQH